MLATDSPSLTDRITRELALELGWPAWPESEPLPKAPPGLRLRPPEKLLEHAARLVGLPVGVLTGPSRETRAVSARAAVARLLRAQGWALTEIGAVIGRGMHAVLYLLNEHGQAEGGR